MASSAVSSHRSTPVVDLTLSDDDDDGIVMTGRRSTNLMRQPVASGSGSNSQPRRVPEVVDVLSDDDDDDDVVEVDREGRAIPQAAAHMPRVSLPPRHQPHVPLRRHGAGGAPWPEPNQAGGSGLQIIDNPPRARRGHPGVAPVAAEAGAGGGGRRLGGAILSLGNARNGFRRIGFAASVPQYQAIDADDDNDFHHHRHMDPNDDGGVRRNAPHPLSFFNILQDLGGNLGQNGFWDFNFGLGDYAANVGLGGGRQGGAGGAGARDEEWAAGNDAPEFKPAFVHKTKHPRPGFTFDFDHLPSSSSIWKPFPSEPGPSSAATSTSSSSSNSNSKTWSTSAAAASLAERLGIKRKPSPTILDVDVDLQPSRSPSSPSSPTSSSPTSTLPTLTLLCSSPSCPRALVLGGDADDRIWALRCGHLLCGACLDRIGVPPPPPLPKSLPPKSQSLLERLGEVLVYAGKKGKGKGRAVRDVKGKGKARASVSVEPDAVGSSTRSAHPFPILEDGSLLPPDDIVDDYDEQLDDHDLPLASRLRSGRRHQSSGPQQRESLVSFSEGWPEPGRGSEEPLANLNSNFIDVDSFPSPSTSTSAFRSRRAPSTSTIKQRRTRSSKSSSSTGKSKGGGGGRHRVLKQWEYECPVEDCKRVHTRVLVGPNLSSPVTAWRAKPDLGEVAVYT